MNNVYDITRHTEPVEEASVWLARLDRELTGPELVDLHEWLATDPKNPEALIEVARIWDRMDILSRLSELFPESVACQPSRSYRSTIALAASIMIAVLVGIWTLTGPPSGSRQSAPVAPERIKSKQVFQTAVGEQSTIKLSDGSQLTLNTNTFLSVSFTDSQRLLELVRGEAYIKVAHDEHRPLAVHVGGKVVKAVGTAFNVKITQDQLIEVIVTEGRVLVAAIDKDAIIPGRKARSVAAKPESPVAISSGEKILLGDSDEDVKEIKPEDIEVKLSWRGGNLVFQGESLAEALEEIERYTSVEFVLMDENLKKLRVVGLFKAGDVEGLLSTLMENFDIMYERVDERVLLTKDSDK